MAHGHHVGAQRRALTFALAANGAYLLVELVVGFAIGSLSLIADAAHMVSDLAALLIALVAQRLAARPHTERLTFGFQRAEVIGAQANAVLLIAASGWIAFEATRRLAAPPDVNGVPLVLVAAIGFVINAVSAVVLERSAAGSLNMRGAVLHMTLDAAGSLAAIAAGVALIIADARWVDPIASLVIVALVLLSALRLLRDATHVLMEGTPRGLDANEIEQFIAADDVVTDVHHVHVWNLASSVPALSAHVVIAGEPTLHEAQLEGDRIRNLVSKRFGIEHTTFELECHACEHPVE